MCEAPLFSLGDISYRALFGASGGSHGAMGRRARATDSEIIIDRRVLLVYDD